MKKSPNTSKAAAKPRIGKAYKPAELEAAVKALSNNRYHSFHRNDARAIVGALHELGFRIIHTGIPI